MRGVYSTRQTRNLGESHSHDPEPGGGTMALQAWLFDSLPKVTRIIPRVRAYDGLTFIVISLTLQIKVTAQ